MLQFRFQSRLFLCIRLLVLFFWIFLVILIPNFNIRLVIFLMGVLWAYLFRNHFLLGIQFQQGSCFLHFNKYVLQVDVIDIRSLRWGWLVFTHQGRYFILDDAMPRGSMHELIWQMHQLKER